MDELNLRNYAYLGDAVWELFVREKTILQTQDAKELHKITTAKVNAKFQRDLLIELQNILTEEEQELVRRGRNLPIPVGRKSNQAEYRMATAFEVLIGWWYKNNPARLDEIEKTLFLC
jgi:ribonuclease III family protein